MLQTHAPDPWPGGAHAAPPGPLPEAALPILLPETLPATESLRAEGIALVDPARPPARLLEIGLVNLMPDKPATELQLARLLGAAPQPVRLHLFWPQGEPVRRTPAEHFAFYDDIDEIARRPLDALIITGAPVEHLPFAEVRFWDRLAAVYAHAQAEGWPTLNICWAALAAAHLFRGLAKRTLPAKTFGVFDQQVLEPAASLMQGLPPGFAVPGSRLADMTVAALRAAGVQVLAASAESGPSVAHDAAHRATLLFDHFEYDAGTLVAEFLRDRAAGLPTAPPAGSALGGASQVPWRSTAHLLVRNWLAEVERHAEARRPPGLLDWLMAPPDDAAPAMLVLGTAQAPLLAGIAAAALRQDVALDRLRATTQDGAAAIEIGFGPGVTPQKARRLATALLRQDAVARVLCRTGDGGEQLVAHAA